jgi:hypothetical protein
MECMKGGDDGSMSGFKYSEWKPMNPNYAMNNAGISCDTCLSKQVPQGPSGSSCKMDSKRCLGPEMPWKYSLWVERDKKITEYHKQDDAFYNESHDIPLHYFDAAGEAMKDAIDADILKDVAEAAKREPLTTYEVWCGIAGEFCVYWTAGTIAMIFLAGAYHSIKGLFF